MQSVCHHSPPLRAFPVAHLPVTVVHQLVSPVRFSSSLGACFHRTCRFWDYGRFLFLGLLVQILRGEGLQGYRAGGVQPGTCNHYGAR